MTEQLAPQDLQLEKEGEDKGFTLPKCFPPSHGVTGPDGRISYRAETFAVVEGYRNLLLDVVVPATSADGPVPVVVWIHGGAFVMGASEEVWSPWFVPMREKVLAAGFAFAALSYRFSAEAAFPAQLMDARAAIRYLRHFAADLGIDGRRLALWGGSAGAQLALLAALDGVNPVFTEQIGVEGEDAPVAAVVDFFGPSDVLSMQADDLTDGVNDHEGPDAFMSRLIRGPIREHEERARAASPISYVSPGAPPVLAVHGTADTAVGPAQSRRLVAALREVGAVADLIEVPGADHGFIGIDMDPILETCIEFLSKHLTGETLQG
ncbi:alpha/beta hydrolase [Paenarthrobacter sp. TYUT067]|uniref:alpha/beta hydrolase fold domain-containing protein n=1 Tax=Paenarthrobacter sp. TYUT067 TaxID=2926245 RepID=UPI00202ED299|nr:alpha/beta hydrolase [Paenarthrobacter sp. TYUT067]MCM0618540.1 alpha/beta hydrolase [Paenarthrobacter sp. TYUT067]